MKNVKTLLETELLENLLNEKLDSLNNRLNSEYLTDWQKSKLVNEKKKLWGLKTRLFESLLGGK